MSVTTMSSDLGPFSAPGSCSPAALDDLHRALRILGVLLWQYGLIRLMVASDRTYISSIIVRTLSREFVALPVADACDR